MAKREEKTFILYIKRNDEIKKTEKFAKTQ